MDDLISRQAAIDGLGEEPEVWSGEDEYAQGLNNQWHYDRNALKAVPSAQPEITDEQAIEHLQESGWMRNHDKQMYDMGLKKQLADDSGSYDSLLPSAQAEQAVKDCRNCKHGKYNDYHDTYFCYNAEDCSNWDKWETSAQAEIIRCRDCKHYQFADNRAFGMPVKMCEWFGFEDVDDYDFCSRAERRTDE